LRLKSNFPSNLKLIWVVQIAKQKYLAGHVGQITGNTPAVSRPPEGRIAIVTTRWARDAMDAAFQRRMKPPRTAKSCGSGAAMLALSLAESSSAR
jgi:hypothetical protein